MHQHTQNKCFIHIDIADFIWFPHFQNDKFPDFSRIFSPFSSIFFSVLLMNLPNTKIHLINTLQLNSLRKIEKKTV